MYQAPVVVVKSSSIYVKKKQGSKRFFLKEDDCFWWGLTGSIDLWIGYGLYNAFDGSTNQLNILSQILNIFSVLVFAAAAAAAATPC
jgi:uncharacterized membrane protein